MTDEVDVVVVGAGLSGIGAACHLARDCPEESVLVLEARGRMGGTWDQFRYPGVRSDSDMFTLAYRFAPWRDPGSIVGGAEILAYLEETARAYGVGERVRLGTRVVGAEWSSATSRWQVRISRGGDESVLACRFLWVCTGYYRYDVGHAPRLAGREDFGGRVVHPQHWPADLDVPGARVVVIGSGATAVSMLPALVAHGAEVTWLQRSPAYLAAIPSHHRRVERATGTIVFRPLAWAARTEGIALQTAGYALAQIAPRLSRALLLSHVRRRLPAGVDAGTHFTPRYLPWEQRLGITPGGDLFDALGSGHAEIVTDVVDRLTATGVRLVSGRELAADVVVTATGLELLGFGGMTVSVDGRPVDLGETLAFRGAMLDGVPNLAFCLGYTGASWTLRVDAVAGFVTRLLRRMRKDAIASVVPRAPADEVVRRPLFALRSSYVLRGIDALPKQGSRAPWTLDQNPVRERLRFRLAPVLRGLSSTQGSAKNSVAHDGESFGHAARG